MSADDAVRVLAEKFASEGAAEYLGEPVSRRRCWPSGTTPTAP
jgi:hypothetical protein